MSVVQEGKNPLSFMKGHSKIAFFTSMSMCRKFKVLLGLSKINIWHVTIYDTV